MSVKEKIGAKGIGTNGFKSSVSWILGIALLLAAIIGLAVGSVSIPLHETPWRIWRIVSGESAWDVTDRILWMARLPRVILATGVGAALALSGLAAQSLFRNPLATPSVVGVSSGAALGAVLGMLLVGHRAIAMPGLMPVFSIVCGLAVTGLVFAMGRRNSYFGHGLLLAGIAIGSLCSSITTAALYLAGERLQTIVFWLMGGLWLADWTKAVVMVLAALVSGLSLYVFAPSMNVALTGERSARDLGLNLPRLQRWLLIVIAGTTSLAVCFTGVIGFIGLIVPHFLRLVLGADHRQLVPASAFGGAILLLVADTIARTIVAPVEIPVGILTSVMGAPVFLWLLNKKQGAPLS